MWRCQWKAEELSRGKDWIRLDTSRAPNWRSEDVMFVIWFARSYEVRGIPVFPFVSLPSSLSGHGNAAAWALGAWRSHKCAGCCNREIALFQSGGTWCCSHQMLGLTPQWGHQCVVPKEPSCGILLLVPNIGYEYCEHIYDVKSMNSCNISIKYTIKKTWNY